MSLSRRQLLAITSLTVASGIAGASQEEARAPIKAIAFDGFPIFDPRPIFALAENLFPGRGAELSKVWRTKQFEYTWLRTMSGHYRDFLGVIDDALVFACKSLDIELTGVKRSMLVESYLKMMVWPDVMPALSILKDNGLRLAFLSNFSPAMLDANIRAAGLEGIFEFRLSTDAVRAYKPDPRAIRWASMLSGSNAKRFSLPPSPAGTPPARSCSAIPPFGSTGRSNRANSWMPVRTARGLA